nr:hypothetical protein [Tanacetum cinerariifolium]
SPRVPIPLPKDPCEVIRQAYFVGKDTESEPFEGEAETPESSHTVVPPTCHVEESQGSGTSGARSTSSDSTMPLSPDHPLTHTTPVLVPSLCMTARMAVRVSHAMSRGLSVSIGEVADMSDLAFRKSEGDELEEEEYKEVEESSDLNRDEGPSMGVESSSLEGDEAVLEGQQRAALIMETAISQSSRFVPESERPKRVSASRHPTLTTWTDPEDDMVYIDVHAYPSPAPLVQTPPSPEWTSGSFPISPSTSIVPSPMISLTVPSPVATPATVETKGFLTELGAQVEMQGGLIPNHTVRLRKLSLPLFERYDKDIGELFTRLGAVRGEIFSQRYQFRSPKHEHKRVTFGALWRPVLALEAWVGRIETRMADMLRAEYDDHRQVYDMLLQQAALQRELQ